MEYGLRHYEAQERLLWFLFLLACLLLALPASWIHLAGVPQNPVINMTSEALRSYGFWSQRHWMHVGPFGKIISYLAWVAILFPLARSIWLILQFVGKSSLSRTLDKMGPNLRNSQRAQPQDPGQDAQKKPYRGLLHLLPTLNHPLRLVFHPYRRAKCTVAAAPGTPTKDSLLDRHQRLSDIDRQVFNASWNVFGWIIRLLPILAALQSLLWVYWQTQMFLGGQKDVEQFAHAFWPAMLPLVQMTALALILGLAHGFLSRVEGLYLANLDALLFDQVLSPLPIRSSDTLLILQSLQKHFRDLQAAVKRMEMELRNRK